MKKKSFDKKLVLNKKTISNLAMSNIKGGRAVSRLLPCRFSFDICDTNG